MISPDDRPEPSSSGPPADSRSEGDLYNELLLYTLAHPDPRFIHQHAVDAWAAQHASESSKPISIIFSLLGLYLFVEKGISGKHVQRFHMQLAKRKRDWPHIPQPLDRGTVTVTHVVSAPPGPERDQAIRDWCASIWTCWKPTAGLIIELCRSELDIR